MRGLAEIGGLKQTLLCPKGSPLAAYAQQQGWALRTFTRSFSVDPRRAAWLAQQQRVLGADLWHLHDPHGHTLAVLASSLGWLRVPLLLHRRVDYPVSDRWLSRYKYNHPAIGRILCVSQAVAEVLRPTLADPSRMRVIHSGIDPARFTPRQQPGRLRRELGLPADHGLVGNVAALTQQKDYFTFLRTVAALGEGFPAQFVIMGEGQQAAELKAYMTTLGVAARVTFLGFRDDIEAVLPELDLLLFPSEKEGLGTTLLDAMAAGVPIVATEVGGIPEIVHHEQTGLLAPVRDAEGLATQVRRLMGAEPDLRLRLISQGQALAQQHAYPQVAAKTLSQYQELW
jgi:glycosyltransferase involved in cell wall biosynthesis